MASRIVVPHSEIGHLKTTPTCLLLGNRQALGNPNDLPHPCMAEQVRMHRRWLACLAVTRNPQRQDADVRSLRSCAHNFPGLLTTDRSPSTAAGMLAREEEWLIVSEPVFLGPEQQRARQVHLTSGQE